MAAQPAVSALAGLAAIVRGWWRVLLTALGLLALVWIARPSQTVDTRLSDTLLVSQKTAPAADFLIIEITAADVRRFGGAPPMNREGVALMMEQLVRSNPKRVMLDLFLGDALSPEWDAHIAAAASRLGPARLGLVSSPTPDSPPYAAFARHSTVLDARLTPDTDGWHRSTGDKALGMGPMAGHWLATGRSLSAPIDLDIRIASRRYARMSLLDFLERKPDLAGRTVIVGTSARIAPTRAFLPQTSVADRAAVIALGAQSVRSDYGAMRRLGERANQALLVLAVALGIACGLRARSSRGYAFLLASGVIALFVLAAELVIQLATPAHPATAIGVFLFMANATLVDRLKILPMVNSFLRGDVSPEEAWAWRTWETAQWPVLLIGADGRIKRSNAAARGLVEEQGDALARLCLPRLGERAREAVVAHGDGRSDSFEIDWPHQALAIAVLRETGAAQAAAREMQAQLLTDELTGAANRRGFDQALHEASKWHAPFTVFYIDMNGFKAVNDTWGHDAGDELLVVSLARLKAQVRAGDTVARLGGDEIAVLMPGAMAQDSARDQAARFVSALSQGVRLTCIDATVHPGAAIGWAMPELPGEDVARVLRRADQAMYADKARCRDARRRAA